MAQGTECWSANQKVASSIPGQGTCLGCGPGPQLGHVRGNHTLMFLPLSFSLPLSLKINKSSFLTPVQAERSFLPPLAMQRAPSSLLSVMPSFSRCSNSNLKAANQGPRGACYTWKFGKMDFNKRNLPPYRISSS